MINKEFKGMLSQEGIPFFIDAVTHTCHTR